MKSLLVLGKPIQGYNENSKFFKLGSIVNQILEGHFRYALTLNPANLSLFPLVYYWH